MGVLKNKTHKYHYPLLNMTNSRNSTLQNNRNNRYTIIHNTWKESLLWSSVMNSGVFGWVTGAAPDVQGKDGEKHHIHSALNSSFVAESRVGCRSMVSVGLINFIKCQYWKKEWKVIALSHYQTLEIFSYSVIRNLLEFYFFLCIFEGPQGQISRITGSLRTIVWESLCGIPSDPPGQTELQYSAEWD